ncbi:MAG: hypothetical protein IPH09_16720 [bacterium]|nr:hypothetical protein [bacterium]
MLHTLAKTTFLDDWCYLNPKLPNGKELCDLLVVFGDQVIVWQVKDLKIHKDGRYSRSKVEKNLRQLAGARRQLSECKTILQLDNPRRGKEAYNPASAKRIILISALLGEGEDFYSMAANAGGHTAHMFTRESGEIILRELDTISDFLTYFEAKESFLNSPARVAINGGEEELLAFYLEQGRSFDILKSADMTIIEGGRWARFVQSDAYKSRQEANRISYGWDSLIADAHKAAGQYEEIARELARPNRVMRRCLADSFAEAAIIAEADKQNNVMRRVIATDGVTFCFLFVDENMPINSRMAGLQELCFVARGQVCDNAKVVGIATEKRIGPPNSLNRPGIAGDSIL